MWKLVQEENESTFPLLLLTWHSIQEKCKYCGQSRLSLARHTSSLWTTCSCNLGPCPLRLSYYNARFAIACRCMLVSVCLCLCAMCTLHNLCVAQCINIWIPQSNHGFAQRHCCRSVVECACVYFPHSNVVGCSQRFSAQSVHACHLQQNNFVVTTEVAHSALAHRRGWHTTTSATLGSRCILTEHTQNRIRTCI